jgi:hypothetical protein
MGFTPMHGTTLWIRCVFRVEIAVWLVGKITGHKLTTCATEHEKKPPEGGSIVIPGGALAPMAIVIPGGALAPMARDPITARRPRAP